MLDQNKRNAGIRSQHAEHLPDRLEAAGGSAKPNHRKIVVTRTKRHLRRFDNNPDAPWATML